MATREEKIQEYLDNLSRKDILEEICRMIADWELDTLIETAQNSILENLTDLDDDELRGEFYEWNYHNFDDLRDDEDQPDSLSAKHCQCDMHQLMRGEGHNPDCPEKS